MDDEFIQRFCGLVDSTGGVELWKATLKELEKYDFDWAQWSIHLTSHPYETEFVFRLAKIALECGILAREGRLFTKDSGTV